MDEIEEIKRRIDITDLISGYLTLKKAGANYRAMCPFHNEKTPSLMISPEKQIFKCFGCNEGGDVFSFIMKMENLEFREALEMLAQRAGVKLKEYRIKNQESSINNPEDRDTNKDRKTKLFRVNAICAMVYHKVLLTHPTGKAALDYLHKRGIKDETIKTFMIGYAPSSRAIKSYLQKKGFTETEIQNAGGPDRFYKRIIFPITDVMGNVLGFTGRTLDKNQEPKYLNTPETIIFHKSRILYNLTRAKGEIKLANTTVIVEGQMDVISSWQAGVKNVVATSGTALTDEHLQILYRYTPNIAFAFDSDTAGMKTSKKAFEMAISQGFNVKVVDLGKYKDPGEVCEESSSEWKKFIEGAIEVIDWYFDVIAREYSDRSNLSSREKKEIADEILPIIKKIPDSIEQADYINKLARKLSLSEQIITDAINREVGQKGNREVGQKGNREVGQKGNREVGQNKLTPEEIYIGVLISHPKLINDNVVDNVIASDSEAIYYDGLLRRKAPRNDSLNLVGKIYKLIKKWYNIIKARNPKSEARNEKQELINYLKSELTNEDFESLQILLLEIETKYSENVAETLIDVTTKINKDKKEIIKANFAREIKEAERVGDIGKLKKLIQDFQDAIK